MTMNDTLSRIKELFHQFCRGDRAEARQQMAALWDELAGGSPYCRCVLAHFIADTQDDSADALDWDLQALQVAEEALAGDPGEERAALEQFLPSLFMNVADGYRKAGNFIRARHYVDRGLETGGRLGTDAYGQTVRAELIRIETQIGDCETGPPVVFDYD